MPFHGQADSIPLLACAEIVGTLDLVDTEGSHPAAFYRLCPIQVILYKPVAMPFSLDAGLPL